MTVPSFQVKMSKLLNTVRFKITLIHAVRHFVL